MARSKTTKRALVVSVFTMLMCITMLIGTTFAWFTDTASTSVNQIKSGTLDVELWQATSDAKLGNDALKWVKDEDASESEEVLWEPGATYDLESFRIKNNGSLALKYQVQISGIVGDAELLDVIDFTVKIGDGTATTLANWDGKLAAEEVTGAITIAGTMKTTAGNEYQDKTIDGISITVVATQDTVEYDSTGNQYDADAPTVNVSNESELRTALYNAPYVKIVLDQDITLSMRYDAGTSGLKDSDEGDTLSNYYAAGDSSDNRAARLVVKAGQNVVLDLNGHTIARGENATAGSWSRTDTDTIANFGTLTITDSSSTAGTIKGSGFVSCGGAVLHNYGAKAILTVEKVNVFGNAAGQTAGTGQNTIINGDAGSTTVQAYPGGTVTIDGAKVYDEGASISACLVKNVSGTMYIKGNATLGSTKALGCDGGTVYVKSATLTGSTYAIKAAVESPATEAVVVVTDSGVTISGSEKTENGGKITHK